MRERSTAIYDHLALGDKLVRTRSGETNAYGNTSRVRPWSGIPRRERDTMSAVSGSLATRRPRTGARCVARLALTVPCPRPPSHAPSLALGSRAGTWRAAPRAPAHVITSWGHGHVRALLGPFSLSRGRAALRVRGERRHHAATVTNRGAPRTTMPGRLGFSIGLLMPFSLAKGIVINNAGCGTNIVTCRAFPSPRRSYQLFFPRPLHFRQKTKRVK